MCFTLKSVKLFVYHVLHSLSQTKVCICNGNIWIGQSGPVREQCEPGREGERGREK